MTRLFISAGDFSGDVHGAHLIRALKSLEGNIECEGLGGKRMERAGMTLRCDLAAKGIMGFTEIVRSFAFIRRLFHDTIDRLAEHRPDALVLIDYPGFNMRLGTRAKTLGIPVIYYISPQVWAWKKGRVRTLARIVDKMIVILPFEKQLYDHAGVGCVYVGHPLLDHIAATELTGRFAGAFLIGLLPGSREQEIRKILPVMLDVAAGIRAEYPQARFATPCVDPDREKQVKSLAGQFPLETIVGNSYEILSSARFCLVASGTATLETALFGVPMAVLYKVSWGTYWLARTLVDIETIALVNILAGKRIVPECIQLEARAETILPRALELIEDSPARSEMIRELGRVKDILGAGGASANAAEEILRLVRGNSHG